MADVTLKFLCRQRLREGSHTLRQPDTRGTRQGAQVLTVPASSFPAKFRWARLPLAAELSSLLGAGVSGTEVPSGDAGLGPDGTLPPGLTGGRPPPPPTPTPTPGRWRCVLWAPGRDVLSDLGPRGRERRRCWRALRPGVPGFGIVLCKGQRAFTFQKG